MKISNIDLSVDYSIGSDTIKLNQSNDGEFGFKLSILDKEMDNHTGETQVMFDNIDELRNILDDYEIRCKEVFNTKPRIKPKR